MSRAFKTGIAADGDITTGGLLKSLASAGDEGGQIDLAKAVTNTTLTTGISIDVYQNKLRFFETGGTNRGFYLDLTTGGTSVGTNLAAGGGVSLSTANTWSATQTFTPAATTGQAIIAKGLASQTGDIQQWQDSSATVLAKLTSAGKFSAVTIDGGTA